MSSRIQKKSFQYFTVIIFLMLTSRLCLADFKKGGDAYKNGDFETAAQEFLKVADEGDHRAMYALGSMYAAGHGVEQDYKEAYKWFSRAAKYGRPDAQYKLGVMYDEGVGVEQDYNKAGKYYSKAAKRGYPLAQYKLGLLYSNGHGVTQNDVKAYAWLLIAGLKLKQSVNANAGKDGEQTEIEVASEQHVKSIAGSALQSINSELDILKNRMTDEQIDEANKLAKSYNR